MTEKLNPDIFVRCDCGAGGINISQDEESGDVYFAMWHYGQHNLTIKHKLRWIWQIIKGKPFKDEIVINDGWLKLLIDHLKVMDQKFDRSKDEEN